MKEYWKDRDKRRGILATTLVHAILLLIFLFFGLTYLEPKPEEGIVINFGNSETGMGDKEEGTKPQTQPPAESQPQKQSEPVEEVAEPTETSELTQDLLDAPAIEKTKEKPKPKPETPSPEELEQKRLEKERAEKRRQLEESFKQVTESKAGGEGVKEGPGDQGDPDGDKNSQNRSGNSGGGGDGGSGNYRLKGRDALQKPKPDYPCTDEGRVVVKIYVNRSGTVTRASAGERIPGGAATTTTSSCLFRQAENAALKTTWQAANDAPELQIGYIIYNFSKQ